MSILKRRQIKAAALATALTAPIAGFEKVSRAQVVNPGDIVVEQVGGSATANGASPLANTGTAVFLDIYTPTIGAGNTVTLGLDTTGSSGVIALPTANGSGASANPLVTSGSATSEGEITISADGSYVLVPGYDAVVGVGANGATGNASSITGSTSTAVPREIGLVSTASGAIDTSTTTSAFSGNNIRTATLGAGSTTIFAGGATSPGVVAVTQDTANTAGTQVENFSSPGANNTTALLTNYRQLQTYNGNLYVSTASGNAIRLASITGFNGSANSGTLTEVPGLAANNSGTTGQSLVAAPYGFGFANNGTVLYVADDGGAGPNNTTTPPGIYKFVLSSGSYVADGSVSAANNATGLTVDTLTGSNGAFTALFYTTPTGIYEISDSSGAGALTGTATQVATAGTNTAFRGDAADISATPEPTSLVLTTFATVGALARRRRRAVLAS